MSEISALYLSEPAGVAESINISCVDLTTLQDYGCTMTCFNSYGYDTDTNIASYEDGGNKAFRANNNQSILLPSRKVMANYSDWASYYTNYSWLNPYISATFKLPESLAQQIEDATDLIELYPNNYERPSTLTFADDEEKVFYMSGYLSGTSVVTTKHITSNDVTYNFDSQYHTNLSGYSYRIFNVDGCVFLAGVWYDSTNHVYNVTPEVILNPQGDNAVYIGDLSGFISGAIPEPEDFEPTAPTFNPDRDIIPEDMQYKDIEDVQIRPGFDDYTPIGQPKHSMTNFAGVLGLCQVLTPDNTQLYTLGKGFAHTNIWEEASGSGRLKLDNILGVYAYPFRIKSEKRTTADGVFLGNIRVTDDGINCISNATEMDERFLNYGKLDLRYKPKDNSYGIEWHHNFLDFEPHTKVQIYLPWVGVRDLSCSDVVDHQLWVLYEVFLETGDFVVWLFNDAERAGSSHQTGEPELPANYHWELKYTFYGNMASQIPISQEGVTGIRNQLKSTAGLLASGAGLYGGLMTGNMAVAGAGLAGVVSNIAGATNNNENYSIHGSFSQQTSLMCDRECYVIITTEPKKIYPEKYNEYFGFPTNKILFIKDVLPVLESTPDVEEQNRDCIRGGMFTMTHVHLDGVPATADEKAEIEQILASGVMMLSNHKTY